MDNIRYSLIANIIRAIPSVIPHLKASYYKTYDFMLRTIEGLVRGVYNGNLGGDFVDILQSLIEGQMRQAYQAAFEDAGFTDMFMPDYLNEALQETILQQTNFDYIYQYYKDIIDARTDGTSIDPLLSRAGLWANRYSEAYGNAVLLINSNNGGRMIWKLGATEQHCSTCAGLNGIVAFAREWDELGVHPQGAPNDILECGGWRCDCSLEATDQRRSPKAYDTILNIVGR